MILSFADSEAEKIWSGQTSKKLPQEIQVKARMKLRMLDAAVKVEDLRVPPANRLHKLEGDRAGQYSISINMQYRICFKWNEGNAQDVEIVDYH
ncbi:type II toxin-antitoxin system RelE/ParE family toxin [Turneriella parva]|uniref:Plasmid maintenance system killer n=1 Tax=Turneriella parva (strain ATCC BAA-1111 / DSM 21527 / NCTC 11395 / H) TaxID=869212 RepID=I4B9L0_TURPD|nr:type II toxin-antitoxin system RelE/ParE family toxin [Turneriella parva]AFM13967.1 plasmid maintenance system killer [Turneriella parva DSM 21527]